MGNVRNILKDLEELDSENQVSVNLNSWLEKFKKRRIHWFITQYLRGFIREEN